MERNHLDDAIRRASEAPVIRKLDSLLYEMTGVGLIVVWTYRSRDGIQQVYAAGSDRKLPAFCRMFHSVPRGRSRCLTCHMLLALAETKKVVLTENVCHGGASVIAAPVTGTDIPHEVDIVIVSSCAFSLADREKGWRLARGRAKDLGVDLQRLREAYRELPELKGKSIDTAAAIVEAAAAALAEMIRVDIGSTPRLAEKPLVPRRDEAEKKLRSALELVSEGPLRSVARASGACLVDIVKSVVSSNPHMRISVSDIARTARLSPNHFSMLFRKVTGQPFSVFVVEKRLALAEHLLRDLTLSIREVAARAGFPDPNYFAKVFHKRTGTSPREWRLRL